MNDKSLINRVLLTICTKSTIYSVLNVKEAKHSMIIFDSAKIPTTTISVLVYILDEVKYNTGSLDQIL